MNRKVRLFIGIEGHKSGSSPVTGALKQVMGLLTNCEVVEKLIDGDVEADVAIVDSSREAMRLQKETEATVIVILCMRPDEFGPAKAFAERSGGRVHAMQIINVVVELITLIGEVSVK
jgi:hypothetical protein